MLCSRLPASLVALALCTAPVFAWSINTHMYSAAVIEADLRDDGCLQLHELVRNPDGTFTLNPLPPIPVPNDVRQAIEAHPECFYAGSCSADGYPDIYVGQSIIHPYEPGQPWRATDWAAHVLKSARTYSSGDKRMKALAYAAGFLVHYAGDAFGHTWVNHYAGGCWDWSRMDIVTRHVSVESCVNSKLPWAGPPRPDTDPSFLRDCLMLADEVQPSITRSGFLKALVDYHGELEDGLDTCNEAINDPRAWCTGAAEAALALKPYLQDLYNDADRALYEWGETSNRAMREMSEGHPQRVWTVVSEWQSDWVADLLLGIPSPVEELLDALGAPMDWLNAPLDSAMERLLNWLWEHIAQGPFESLVNPEMFMQQAYTAEERAQVDADLHFGPDGKLDPGAFEPLYDTIVLGKLTLLDESGVDALGQALGVTIPFSGSDDNILWHCIESLDASNQLYLYPRFRLLETEELTNQAFRRLFKSEPQEQQPSAIDPTHVLAWVIPGTRQVWFGIPLLDPGHDRLSVIGYQLQSQPGAPPKRVPIFEEHVPSSGDTSRYTELVRGSFVSRTDATVGFHLATRQKPPGANDFEEDVGIDVTVPVKRVDLGQTDLSATIAQLEQVLATAPPAMRAQLEQMLQALREAQARSAQSGVDPNDPLVLSPEVFNNLWYGIQHPEQTAWSLMTPEERASIGAQRVAVGVVQDAAGQPVAGATVTLVATYAFNDLKSQTGTPRLLLDYLVPGKYCMGRTNIEGQYLLSGVEDGHYTLVASAPGHGRAETQLYVQIGDALGKILPTVSLPAAATGQGTGGGATTEDTGQASFPPRFQLESPTSYISLRQADQEGRVDLAVTLRSLSHFQGPVELSLEGLPDGIEAEFPTNPVTLGDEPQAVHVVLTPGPDVRDKARVVLRATSGQQSAEVPLTLALGRGVLVRDPERLTLKPGESTTLRLTWEGAGQAVRLICPRLPEGVSAAVEEVQWHPSIRPVPMADLTVARVLHAVEPLRAEPALAKYPVPQPTVTDEQLRDALPGLLRNGVLLAPGGWVEVSVSADAGAPPGRHPMPILCKIGRFTQRYPVQVVIEP